MFREALGYPTRAPEGGRSVIVGGLVLVVIAACLAVAGLDRPYAYLAVVSVVPWLLIRGYYVRVVRTTIGRERPTPPRFDDVRSLLSDGAIAAAISIAYVLPGAVILGPLVALRALEIDPSVLLTDRAVPTIAVDVVVPVVGILAVFAFMYTIGALYVLPVAVARFAHSGRMGAAFEIKTIVSGAMTEDYAIAWGISFVLQALFLPFAYLLRVLVIGFFFEFIVAVGVRYCYGQGVGAALGLDPVRPVRERIDPDKWGLPPAVRRLGSDEIAARSDRTVSESRPTPAVRRIEDAESESAETPDEPDEGTFGGGFRPAVGPNGDDSEATETETETER